MSYLAIDYGTKRVGLAVSRGSLAVPLMVLPNQDNLFDELARIITEEKAQKVIVGLSESEMAIKTKNFVLDLEKRLEIPVIFVDETLSSQEVEQRIRQDGIKQKVRNGPIDHFAAALILEDWLEQNYHEV